MIQTILKNWFGTPTPPVQHRRPSARWEAGRRRQKRRELVVRQIVPETPTTTTYVLEPAEGGPIVYAPGQHLTLFVPVDGHEERRCYSFSSTPGIGSTAITVKEIPGGRVSGWLARELTEGARVRAAEPAGIFTIEPDVERERDFVMIAGGVGITPIISMAEAVLRGEPKSFVTLVYGNRDESEIVFRSRIDALAAEFGERLAARYALDDVPEGWTGERGPLTGERTLQILGGARDGAEYLVCGPAPMMDSVTDALRDAGVAEERVRLERFTYADASGIEHPKEAFTVRFTASGREVRTTPGTPILQSAVASGIELPYSCQMGGCGECKVRASRGSVVMDQPNCLTEREREEGWILTCCSYAATDLTIESR